MLMARPECVNIHVELRYAGSDGLGCDYERELQMNVLVMSGCHAHVLPIGTHDCSKLLLSHCC